MVKKRNPKVVKKLLKKKGLTKVPPGKEADHKIPLADGGSDTLRNLHLIKKKRHADNTAREARARAKKKNK